LLQASDRLQRFVAELLLSDCSAHGREIISMNRPQIDTVPNMAPVGIVDGRPMADSREIAATFGRQHKDVLRAYRDLNCSDDFRRRNFAPFKIKDLNGESLSHVLMTKNGFSFLVLGFTGTPAAVFKEAYIERFDAMEQELRAVPVPAVPQTLPEALRLAADLADKVAAQDRAIAVLEPRSEALAAIADAEGLSNVTVTAKTLQMPPGELWAYLRRERWVYKRDRDGIDVAMQTKIDAGYLTHKTVPVDIGQGRTWAKPQIMVTPKGLTVLATRLGRSIPPYGGTPSLLPSPSPAARHG
jgi:Rha family phage regulatory protein